MADFTVVRPNKVQVDTIIQLLQQAGTSFENMTLYLAALADKSDGLHFKHWSSVQGLVRAGLHLKIFDQYSQFTVDRVTSVNATTNDQSLAVTVDMDTFEAAMGEAINGAYEFIYDGAAWKYNDNAVELSTYGISLTGTPAADDIIVIHETSAEILYDVLGCDYDIPADGNLEHSMTICVHDMQQNGVLAYKKPQALFYVNPSVYPDGLAAGTTYAITLLNGAYNASTDQDGTYEFTPSVAIPAGGAIRHTAIGNSESNGYSTDQIVAGTFVSYDTIENERVQLEAGIACTLNNASTATNLGTFTAENVTLRSSVDCNLTRRSRYGSNNYFESDERMWMNSDGAALADWFEFKSVFDLPATAAIPGYLHGIDPSLVKVIGKVRKRTYLHSADRSDSSVKYVDTEEMVFPLSMTEVGFGANDGVYEGPVSAAGVVTQTPYPYYANASNADRIKYQGGTARAWWLRSPNPSHADYVRNVLSSGALSNANAHNTNGAVSACAIV